jgi:phospholipase/carboxylesterase
LGDSPSGIAPLLRDLDAPARVIAPAAPTPRGSGFSWFDIRARDGRVEVLSQALAEAADALGERLEALAAARGAEEVVVIGFSQGGMLAFALAVRRPELVRAAVPIGGLLPPPLWPDRAPSDAPLIRAFHGEADRVVPFEAAEATASALAEAGYDARLETEPGLGHGISRRLRARARAALEALLSGASGG